MAAVTCQTTATIARFGSVSNAQATRKASVPRAAFLGQRLSISSSSRGVAKVSKFVVRATAEDEVPPIVTRSKELLEEAKSKWETIDDKSTVLLYGGGAIVALWLSSTIVSAVNSIPLLPKVLELVGTVYTGWFAYRYLLFKSSRRELSLLIDDIKSKITDKK
ncbi:hypothetical protein CLOM_g7245 [Closterium sp. NIES-68]|nr:hypothetical protein CLOM_g7245 [Closterium sp. NIES-68]GJP83260.1 hypothetical protein CLOP_g13433 [Closterium sp. NIES-67]